MTVFAEKILERAIEAFPGHQLDEDLIMSQLIDVFIDGLRDPLACKRILRDAPATFQGAVDIAVGEARLNAKIFGRNVRFPPSVPAPQRKKEVCLFVCGISLTSGQLVSELFPDYTRSCFSQVVLRPRGGDRIYEMRCLFVAVGPNARFKVLPHWDNMS